MAREAAQRHARLPGINSRGEAMETKSHHLLIGIVALLTLVSGVILVLWLGRISFEEKLPYRVYSEDSVATLASDAAVRMNGVRIGSVDQIKLDPANPQTVLITLEIKGDIVITEDATATLESEGFIGPAFVGIASGRVDASPLRHDGPDPPIIPYKRSDLNQIVETLPEILNQVRGTAANFEAISAEVARHREGIGTLIADAGRTVSSLDRAAEEAVDIVGDAGNAVQQVNDLIAQLDDVLGRRLEPMMAKVEETVSSLAGASREAEQLIADNRQPLDQFATQGLRDLRQLISETRRMVDNTSRLVAELERHPTAILFGAPQPTFRPEAR